MEFLEMQFPAEIAYGSSGGPMFATDVVINNAGFEQRNRVWDVPLARYNVAHGLKTPEQLDALIAFFRIVGGRAKAFRFKDWIDYQAQQQTIAVGDGSTMNFPLIKAYSYDNEVITRQITKPVQDSVTIYVDGAIVVPDSIDYSTGMVSLDSAPASGEAVVADFQFDVPVRFDTDILQASLDEYGVRSWKNIPLVEVRL